MARRILLKGISPKLQFFLGESFIQDSDMTKRNYPSFRSLSGCNSSAQNMSVIAALLPTFHLTENYSPNFDLGNAS